MRWGIFLVPGIFYCRRVLSILAVESNVSNHFMVDFCNHTEVKKVAGVSKLAAGRNEMKCFFWRASLAQVFLWSFFHNHPELNDWHGHVDGADADMGMDMDPGMDIGMDMDTRFRHGLRTWTWTPGLDTDSGRGHGHREWTWTSPGYEHGHREWT